MKIYTQEELKAMSLNDAKAAVSSAVYEATQILESLENVGKILGNGHHLRQQVCAFAGELMEDRWIEENN